MSTPRKILLASILAVVAGGALYFYRDGPDAAPQTATETARSLASPRAPDEAAPSVNAPVAQDRKASPSSDPYEFIRGLAKSAYEGDGRAQYLVAREFDKCEATLSLLRKQEGDPETNIWESPNWPQTLKERSIAEYRRCIRLMKEDPFAELPPHKGGYPPRYWMQRSAEAGYPLAVADRGMNALMIPPADAAAAAITRAGAVHELTQASVSGDPDVALTIGMRQSFLDDPVRKTAGSAWMLAACRMGADCGASSKVYPFWMCYDPDHPNCDTDANVELVVSMALSPEKYADAYAQSEVIEQALRSRNEAALKALLERLLN